MLKRDITGLRRFNITRTLFVFRRAVVQFVSLTRAGTEYVRYNYLKRIKTAENSGLVCNKNNSRHLEWIRM